MADLPTRVALFRIGRDEILGLNAALTRDAVEREGMDANVLLAAAAAIGDEVMRQVARLLAASFLDSANDSDLDRLVFDRYGLVRKPAAVSQGTVAFSATAPSPTTFTIPAGTKLSTANGVQFLTSEAVSFPIGSTGPILVAARSTLAGGDQNVKAGTITSLISPITSQPSDLVVTNPLATTGGDNVEQDDSLRDRARRFFSTVRRGTLGALEAAALGVSGVRKAAAFEVLDALGRPARYVRMVVSDSFTEQFVDYASVPPLYQVQSQLLSTTVFNALSDTRAAGIYVEVTVANVILQAFQLALTFAAGTDVSLAALRARAAVVNYTNDLKPGAPVVLADLTAKLAQVPGLVASSTSVISPAGNILAKPLQVIRTSLGLVSAVAAQTDQPVLVTGTNPDAFFLAEG